MFLFSCGFRTYVSVVAWFVFLEKKAVEKLVKPIEEGKKVSAEESEYHLTESLHRGGESPQVKQQFDVLWDSVLERKGTKGQFYTIS